MRWQITNVLIHQIVSVPGRYLSGHQTRNTTATMCTGQRKPMGIERIGSGRTLWFLNFRTFQPGSFNGIQREQIWLRVRVYVCLCDGFVEASWHVAGWLARMYADWCASCDERLQLNVQLATHVWCKKRKSGEMDFFPSFLNLLHVRPVCTVMSYWKEWKKKTTQKWQHEQTVAKVREEN